MLKIIGLAILALIVGYGIGLFGGMWLVNTFSANVQDRELEAAMTGAFVYGPLTALLALVGTLLFLFIRARS